MKTLRESSYKIPGGKLVKIKLEAKMGKITDVKILGDFFLHPEEVILTIESTLKGLPLNESELTDTIDLVLKRSEATLIGATPSDFAKTIMMAWNSK